MFYVLENKDHRQGALQVVFARLGKGTAVRPAEICNSFLHRGVKSSSEQFYGTSGTTEQNC